MFKFANFTKTLLATAIGTSDTVVNVSTGAGSAFPTLTEGERFKLVVANTSTGEEEIMHGTAISSDAITVERALESTTAKAFPTNSIVYLAKTREVEESLYRRRRSRLRNGLFRWWDFGTSFATPATTTRVAAGWRVMTSGTVGTFTISRQSITPGTAGFDHEPEYSIRWDQTVASGSGATLRLVSRIEDVRNFAGKTICVAFWAKTNSGSTNLTVSCRQNFGTGGSPSADVETTANYPTQPMTLTAAWKRYYARISVPSVAGKTFGSNGDNFLEIRFGFTDAVTFQTEITHVDVAEGPIPTVMEYLNPADERALLNRYYFTTFPNGTAPTQNAGVAGSLAAVVVGAVATSFNIIFPSKMRTTPTVTTYNPSAANSSARNTSLGADGSTSAVTVTENNAAFYTSNGSDAAGHVYRVHVTADADL